MDSLPDCLIQCILSRMSNAKDVAACNCVSKRWKESIPYLRSLFFPRNLFDNLTNGNTPDAIVSQMISSIEKLEDLVVYCPFSSSALATWLSVAGPSLKNLVLQIYNIVEYQTPTNPPLKLESIRSAWNLESLKLWGVLMIWSSKCVVFHRLKNLEIVGASLSDYTLSEALQACPNLTHLVLLGCEGLRNVTIGNPHLEQCKLAFIGGGICALTSSKLESLEVQGCSMILASETQWLKKLSISNIAGRISFLHFGKLFALETLSIWGVQWCWNVSRMLQMANEVKHLYIKVVSTGDADQLLPFPEIDFVDFFTSHPKLQTLECHGAMFAALCQKNSLKNVNSSFFIPSLEKIVITIGLPLNAEQKMGTLELLLKSAKNMRKMIIRIRQMKSGHSSADAFLDDICRFKKMNDKIVSIEWI